MHGRRFGFRPERATQYPAGAGPGQVAYETDGARELVGGETLPAVGEDGGVAHLVIRATGDRDHGHRGVTGDGREGAPGFFPNWENRVPRQLCDDAAHQISPTDPAPATSAFVRSVLILTGPALSFGSSATRPSFLAPIGEGGCPLWRAGCSDVLDFTVVKYI